MELRFEAFSDALERQHNERMALAWHIAALSRQKRLPRLKSLMASPRPRRQTWQEQMHIMDMWAARINAQQEKQ